MLEFSVVSLVLYDLLSGNYALIPVAALGSMCVCVCVCVCYFLSAPSTRLHRAPLSSRQLPLGSWDRRTANPADDKSASRENYIHRSVTRGEGFGFLSYLSLHLGACGSLRIWNCTIAHRLMGCP